MATATTAHRRAVSPIAGSQRRAPRTALGAGGDFDSTQDEAEQNTIPSRRIITLLRPKAESKGGVAAELPFRAPPEYDLRGAEVAFVAQSRWDSADADDNLNGSPELVIEVLSPCNTKSDMREKAAPLPRNRIARILGD